MKWLAGINMTAKKITRVLDRDSPEMQAKSLVVTRCESMDEMSMVVSNVQIIGHRLADTSQIMPYDLANELISNLYLLHLQLEQILLRCS